jgi:hypothetical protein
MLFALKLILTPLLIAIATLIARRWGSVVGGIIVGLPLTSGPVSVFLALEQGREFAAVAAHSVLLGILAVLAFCLVYAFCAKKFSWLVTATIALFCYLSLVAVLSRVTMSTAASTLLVIAAIALALRCMGPGAAGAPQIAVPRWDLPFRMAAATIIILTITGVSTFLGPVLSGLLSAFPVFVCVMSVFSHALYGPAAACQFARGVIAGSFSFVAFFFTVLSTIGSLNLFLVYLLAIAAAGAVSLASLVLFAGHKTA